MSRAKRSKARRQKRMAELLSEKYARNWVRYKREKAARDKIEAITQTLDFAIWPEWEREI